MSIHSLLHTSEPAAPDVALSAGVLDPISRPPLDVGEPADCCCAAAQVRVVFPPVAGRTARPELRLCAHHYREAASRLIRAGADSYDGRGRWLPAREQFWGEPSGPTPSATQQSAAQQR